MHFVSVMFQNNTINLELILKSPENVSKMIHIYTYPHFANLRYVKLAIMYIDVDTHSNYVFCLKKEDVSIT